MSGVSGRMAVPSRRMPEPLARDVQRDVSRLRTRRRPDLKLALAILHRWE
jgi:hypothetical protein